MTHVAYTETLTKYVIRFANGQFAHRYYGVDTLEDARLYDTIGPAKGMLTTLNNQAGSGYGMMDPEGAEVLTLEVVYNVVVED